MSAYGDWVISQMVKQKISTVSEAHRKLMMDIFERWLIRIANDNKTIGSADKSYASIKKEYKDRGHSAEGENFINKLKILTKPLSYSYPYHFTADTFTCSNYKIKLAPERLKILLSLGGEKKTGDMLLQYASIMVGEGNFWSITPEDYKKLQVKYGATVEGFASPLNSQFLMISKDLRYCSVLPIDKNFNSLGSFFDQDFKNKTVICNPPFINDFMLEVVNFAEKSGGTFIFVVPTRPGVPFYDKLKSSKKFKSEEIWRANTYYYENNTNYIKANFDTSLLCWD